MSDNTFFLGQAVTVDDEEGEFTIVKLLKSSAKVEQNGIARLKPFAILSPVGGEAAVVADGGTAEAVVETAPKPEKPSRKRSGSTKEVEAAVPDTTAQATTAPKPGEDTEPAKRKYPRTNGDNIAKILSTCDTPNKVISAVKSHTAYEFVNCDAFKALVASKDVQFGLFRMRAGNLLRGAVGRSVKGKTAKATSRKRK